MVLATLWKEGGPVTKRDAGMVSACANTALFTDMGGEVSPR